MLSAKVCAAGLNPPLLAGNIISNGMSLLVIVTLTYIFPDKVPFQWEAFKEKITTADATVRHPHGSCQCSAGFLLFFCHSWLIVCGRISVLYITADARVCTYTALPTICLPLTENPPSLSLSMLLVCVGAHFFVPCMC